MESTSFKSKFLAEINNSFGSGGMSLAFNEATFSSFIQYLKKGGLPIKKSVEIIGLQGCKITWIVNENLHIDCNGNVIDDEHKIYTWLPEALYGKLGNIRLCEVLPNIELPLTDNVLKR